MYLYKPQLSNHLKFKFDGLESVESSYAQCLQDMFVLAALNGKRNGTFLEIGAFEAKFISNTYLLESTFGWRGASVDIEESSRNSFLLNGRMTAFYLGDALKMNYDFILSRAPFTSNRIDYLTLDIEPSVITLACLKLLPLDRYRFSCITYETDYYDPATPKETSEAVRAESRRILEDKGYVLVAGNLSNLNDDNPMEDWWMDSQYFDKEWIAKFRRSSDSGLAAHRYFGLPDLPSQ